MWVKQICQYVGSNPLGAVQGFCGFIAITWDVVYLAMTVMLQSVAATAAAPTATVLGTSHTHEAAGHGQLRGLGKVGQDASSGVGQASLQGRLRLRGLQKHKHHCVTYYAS